MIKLKKILSEAGYDVDDYKVGDKVRIDTKAFRREYPEYKFPNGNKGRIEFIDTVDYNRSEKVFDVEIDYIDPGTGKENILSIEPHMYKYMEKI